MKTTRKLVRKVVEQGLLSPDVLLPPVAPVAPDGYELIRLIGQGGCGEVYLARDMSLERLVAIKFLIDASPADLERFRREARFTARLNNPTIIAVYEMGEAQQRPYISMQYVDGGNLAGAQLDPAGVVRVLREVAQALAHAHAQGIVHRDIKPQNILLDREGRAYLGDFGIARDLRGDPGDTISRAGQIIGTPGLMPPEQARGEIQAVDARSDIYSLGATLYFKLAGRSPFDGTNVVDVLHAVIHDAPRLLRSQDASVPRSLEAIVLRCMQKAREDRYQTMDDLVAEFDRFLIGDSLVAESSAWFRRLVGARFDAPQPEPADDIRSDPYWTVGLEIVRQISAWDADLYRVSGSLSRSFARLDVIREQLDGILTTRPETAWARFYRGVVLFRQGKLYEAVEDMERAIDRVKNLGTAYFELGRLYLAIHLKQQQAARKHITAHGIETGLSSARGRLEQAVVAFQEAQRLSRELPPWLEDCTLAVKRLAESDYKGCVKLCDRMLSRDQDVEGLWKLRGDAQRLAGADPLESYDRALGVRRTYFEALYAKAETHLDRDELDEARAALQRACEIHPAFTDAVALLARTYLVEARLESDAKVLDFGLRIAEQAIELDARNYDAAVVLAEIQLDMGRSCDSDEWLASALDTLKGASELEGCPNRVNLLTAQINLERARRAQSHGRDNRPQLEAVVEFCRHQGDQVSDNEAWEVIRAEAERELALLS